MSGGGAEWKYSVWYFGVPGRGEPARMALTLGGISFEDKTITRETWAKEKPTTPWGTVPVLLMECGDKNDN
eukprot:UN10883